MGLIKEPKEIDFYVIDKPWTEEEKHEFSELIEKQKQELAETQYRTTKSKAKKHSIK
ncbi:MAG: hypothetical protein WCH34_12295 [Bacteroidota bacterium]